MEQQEQHKKKLRSAAAGSIVTLLNVGIFAALMIVVMLHRNDIMQGIAGWKKAQGDEKLQVQAAETEPVMNQEEPEETPEKQTEDMPDDEEEYATSHMEETVETEEIPEPVATFPLRLTDVYAEKGSVAVFRCYDPEATHYLWETYDPQTEGWVENGDAVEITDELYRRVSTLLVEADDSHSELAVRCMSTPI